MCPGQPLSEVYHKEPTSRVTFIGVHSCVVLQPGGVVQDHNPVGGHRVQYFASLSFATGEAEVHGGARDMCKVEIILTLQKKCAEVTEMDKETTNCFVHVSQSGPVTQKAKPVNRRLN